MGEKNNPGHELTTLALSFFGVSALMLSRGVQLQWRAYDQLTEIYEHRYGKTPSYEELYQFSFTDSTPAQMALFDESTHWLCFSLIASIFLLATLQARNDFRD